MPMDIDGSAPTTPVIEVSALFGHFRVPGSQFTVHFASTFANSTSIGHRELLKELKPMRDRVDASALTDLTALLQRDLNDKRVALELIPYLLGTGRDVASRVGFFPAVLAVLIPKEYLRAADANAGPATYPTLTAQPSPGATATYQSSGSPSFAWEVNRYSAGGQQLHVGLLRLNPRECEVVVLDGQHRSNAFRYLAGDFDPSRDVYSGFYEGIERPAEFDADLPVTVIWFEALGESSVQPRLISRQLFVDVNNSAHSVSLSRTILLDDQSVSALATQAFYNQAAQASFRTGSFSLLHAAFDMDSDLAASSLPPMALTSPEIVESAFLWLLLAAPTRAQIGAWRVERLRSPRSRAQFVQVAGTTDGIRFGSEDDDASVRVASPAAAEQFRVTMGDRVVPVMLQLMNGITMLESHYAAGQSVERWVMGEGDTTVRIAWEKIFTGGEGLYWTVGSPAARDARNRYALACTSIEARFRQSRADALGCSVADADAAFRSFSTKAFQIGFAMAASFLAFRDVGGTDVVSATEEMLRRLNRFTPQNWLAFFRELRPMVFGGDATPRMWPSYRNMLLRMFDDGADEIVDVGDLPELEALRRALDRVADRLVEDDAAPSDADLARIVTAERNRISEAFERAGLRSAWFHSPNAVTRGHSMLRQALDDRA